MKCIFLHGLAGSPDDIDQVAGMVPSWEFWNPLIPYFMEEYQTLEDLAGRIEAELPKPFTDRTIPLVGNSLGGALVLALGHHFDHLVLVSTHISIGTRMISRNLATLYEELDRIFYDPETIPSEKLERYEQMWLEFTGSRKKFRRLRQIKKMTSAFDFDAYYQRLQDKILLVCGRHDQLSPVSSFQELNRKYPEMRMIVVEKSGHAIPLEQPEVLAGILKDEFENRAGEDL